MLKVTCTCGAHYRVPENLAGKRAKCKHCDAAIPIPAAPASEEQRPSWIPPLVDETGGASESHVELAPVSIAGYWRDCSWSFLFVSEPANLITFLIIGAIAAMQPVLASMPGMFYLGIILFLAQVIISGWIWAFLFGVVQEAAQGNSELPSIHMADGIVDNVIAPLFKFLATWVIVLIPAIIYAGIRNEGIIVLINNHDPGLFGLIAAAVFLWPMSVLVIALGGVSSFYRFDLILGTIAKTFIPYLLACFLTAVALGVLWYASRGAIQGAGAGARHPLALAMVLEVAELYAWVVAMRVIGLYYRHFKSRFAWSWG